MTEFANNLNNYVEQHYSAQKKKNYSQFLTLQNGAGENGAPTIEESPKDNIRHKIRINSQNKNNYYNEFSNNNLNEIKNDDFKIINYKENKIEEKNKNNNNNKLSFSSLMSKDYDYSITISNNKRNINCNKINIISENQKDIKILRNLDNNEDQNKNNKKTDIIKDKDKDKQFEENLYSSEEEKNKNLYDSEDESDDGKSERVKEIKERKTRDSSMTRSMIFLTNEEIKNKLKKDKENLKEKIENVKSEILKLIGKEDYNYTINLYSKVGNNIGGIDEVYHKIEEYIKNKYQDEKKEIFNELYLSLISYDCQLTKKEQQLKKYL